MLLLVYRDTINSGYTKNVNRSVQTR